jgi:hypothetical protein
MVSLPIFSATEVVGLEESEMSVPKSIAERLTRQIFNDQPHTEVRFAQTRIGDFEMVIAVEERLIEKSNVSEEEVEQELVREGLIRVPSTSERIQDEFSRIDVAGKPISEMIIEERR